MKKVLILFLVMVTILSIAGCAKQELDYEIPNNTVPTIPIPEIEQTEPDLTVTIPTRPPHKHEYTETVVDVTCTEDGYTEYTCECGHIYQDNVVKATGHKYITKTVDATYTEKGYDINTCSVCNYSYKDNYTDVIPHEHNYKGKAFKPTCTEKGYYEYTCSLCGKSYKENFVDATGHKYEIRTIKPTCTEKGYQLTVCTVCKDEQKDNYTDKIAHEYTTKTVAPTGKEKGYDLHTCKNCGDTYKDNYTEPVVTYKEVNETVYAIDTVNIRKGPSTDHDKLGQLKKGESITRIAIGDNGWSKVMYKDEVAYISNNYLSTDKPPVISESGYPKTYSDSTCTITIYKEWYKNAYVYAAHLQFTDYSRFGTSCANGKYNNGYETTSHAAKRLGAIFCVNGCYSAPYLEYGVIRSGVVCNDKKYGYVAGYSNKSGLFGNLVKDKYNGPSLTELAETRTVTDTFCFGPEFLVNSTVVNCNDTSRAQRTFIGTNGNAGDIWVCVSDGRKNDGKSSGLTYRQCAEFLASKGCTFGIPLDGGGSSTMYFNGKVLNAAKGNQRAVVDFVYFK